MKRSSSPRRWPSSAIVIAALAAITFVLVAGVLSAAQRKAPVVVAARALEAGTRLSLADVEIVHVHAGAVLEGAFETTEGVVGSVTTVQRLPGDQVTAAMVGDSAQNALAQALDPGHRAVAIHVNQASGVAGLLRPGDTVSAVGIIDPSALGGMAYQRATGAASKVLLTGLKVLFVPYEFRYRELNPEEDGSLMSPVMASSAGRENGVVILGVPVEPITVTWHISDIFQSAETAPTEELPSTSAEATSGSGAETAPASSLPDSNPALRVSPVELLALLDAQSSGTDSAVHLVLEPADEIAEAQTPGLYLSNLLPGAGATTGETELEATSLGGESQ